MDNFNKFTFIQKLYESSSLNNFSGVLSQSNQTTISSSHKLLLEGVDFSLIYNPLKHLGYKSILAAIGPLYADSLSPFALSIRVALSNKLKIKQVEELWEGMSAAFKEHHIDSVELDLLPSLTGLTISLNSYGKQKRGQKVQPPEVKKGDLLVTTGTMGAAYLGLQILERERRVFEESRATQPKLEEYKFVLGAYLSPYIERSLFEELSKSEITPSSGHFVTDGLAHTVKLLCSENNLGAKLFMERIPFSSPASLVAEELNIDPMTAVLNGGDDFKFLFTIPLEQHEKLSKEFPQLDIIGYLTPKEEGTLFITPDGQKFPLKAQAWDK